ncbi:hypothetical protein F7731_09520 [Cytobacillus depressus]|uniref:Lipoprotein n=1 Tax=Cytobacillus depressus TaxID=1602942 RepID=A0A6L3V8B3_9BACI|nr:hypothetical protein [Cytobacillus depressus]KAB2336595.1 hypothetical protein F7731_09520 [Cytobacillus depressus]
MKRLLFIITLLLLVVGCNTHNNSQQASPPSLYEQTNMAEIQEGDFKLVVKSNKSVYEKDEEIKVIAYIEYTGEQGNVEIVYGDPLISLSNSDSHSFNEPRNTLTLSQEKKSSSETVRTFKLDSGEHKIYALADFSVDNKEYNISLDSLEVEVK